MPSSVGYLTTVLIQRSITEKIHHLNLAKNKLAELKKQDFVNIVKLQVLNLTENAIQHIPARFFAPMKKLTVLDLSNNKLDEKLKDSVFKTLPAHMSYLDISSKLTLYFVVTQDPCSIRKNLFLAKKSCKD